MGTLSLAQPRSLSLLLRTNTMRTSLQLPIILSIFLSILSAAQTQWSPPDNILINCGTSEPTKDPWRTWLGDMINSKYSPTGNSTLQIPKPTSQPITNVQPVPYRTARLSRSQFNYSIPLARPSGPVFLRLHFFPAEYPTFDTSAAFFSVRAGPYTLLSNFSATLNADPSTSTVYREFCIVVPGESTLNLTFTPSKDYPDSYAFINGIEVVSMPEFLYYSDPMTDDHVLQMVGSTALFSINTDMGLEMAYRINAGSKALNPNEDTGMSRIWEDDDDYLTIDLSSVTPVNRSTELKLNFSRIPNYTAPAVVYQTARTMGTDKTTNMRYNLTWGFPVDPGFNYLVRLHFCEFQNEINDVHDREFTIFIAGMIATARADIITWSGGKGIPFYQDYVVVMGTESSSRNKKLNLAIAMQTRKAWMTKYSDAILNGLEIFKISNEGNLAGPNLDPVLSITPPPASPFIPQKPNKTWVLIVLVTTAGVATLSLLFFLIFRRPGAKHSRSSHGGGASKWSPFSMSTNKSSTAKGGSSLPSDLCRHFSLGEIKTATNGFDKVFIIGVGGFGNVYKGFIDGDGGADRVPVAIKRLNPGSQQGAREFMTEIEMLSRLRHLNLVSLIGYCEENGEMILVYDYMSRGTLRDHLYDTENPALPWDQRLKICIGAASGLQYLHTGAKHPVIHRDVKSTNILLDDKWVAKVSDFGLSRTGATSVSNTHVTTMVKGSLGYLDPEYRRRQHLTEKSDLYSFGVVLLEVLCGRPALLNRTAERKQVSLAEWGQYCYEQGTVDEIVDQNLKGMIAPECLKKYTEVAVRCLHDSGAERPSMSDVAWDLKFVLEMQQTADERNKAQLGSKCGDLMMNIDEISFSSDSKSSGITMGSYSNDQSFSVKDSDALLISNTVFS